MICGADTGPRRARDEDLSTWHWAAARTYCPHLECLHVILVASGAKSENCNQKKPPSTKGVLCISPL